MRALALTLGVCLALTSAVYGQDKKDKKPWPGGRVKFKRAQGKAKDLRKKIEELMKLLAERPASPVAPTTQPERKTGEGLKPPVRDPKPDEPARAKNELDAKILKLLRSFAPGKQALLDALKPEGVRKVGKPIYRSAKKLFAGNVDSIVTHLKIHRDYQEVHVHVATTEDLLTMELGTVAAKEFASGLRRSARLLKDRYWWYVVVLKKPKAKKASARLQLFFFHNKRYVLLGRIWRLDKPQ